MPWTDQYIADKCHMWRYGEDLAPIWTGKFRHPGTGGSGTSPLPPSPALPKRISLVARVAWHHHRTIETPPPDPVARLLTPDRPLCP